MTRPTLEDTEPTGALAERRYPDGRRRISLTLRERQALQRQERAEAAAALFCTLDEKKPWKEIAEELGLSVGQLKDLTKSPEFDDAYNRLFAELGHDPRYKAAVGAVADMLPIAIRELSSLITTARTPAGVKLRAIEKVIKLNGLDIVQNQQSDRRELADFLQAEDLDPRGITVTIPPEYLAEYDGLIPDVIDGEIRDIPPDIDIQETDVEDQPPVANTQDIDVSAQRNDELDIVLVQDPSDEPETTSDQLFSDEIPSPIACPVVENPE